MSDYYPEDCSLIKEWRKTKPVIIGAVVAAIVLIAAFFTAGLFLGWFSASQPMSNGETPSPSPSPTSQPSPSPTVLSTSPTTPPKTNPVPPPTTSTVNVNFELAVTTVSGTGLSRTVTAQITNTGNADAHNVWVKVEVSSQGQRIQLSGQDYLGVDIGTVKAGATVTAHATLSFGILDGLKIQADGADFVLTIYSDEPTQTLTYFYKP
jgi:hypothetical protein